MTIEQISEAIRASPFVPFTIHVSDGRNFPIVHPEFIMRVGQGRVIYVSGPNMRSAEMIDLLHVTSISFQIDQQDQAQAG